MCLVSLNSAWASLKRCHILLDNVERIVCLGRLHGPTAIAHGVGEPLSHANTYIAQQLSRVSGVGLIDLHGEQ